MSARTALVSIARRLIPPGIRQRILGIIGRRRFSDSMITREGRSEAWMRRTFTQRRPVLRHLDVHVTDHCNLGCRGCEHYSPLCAPAFADLDEMRAELARLAVLFEDIEQIYILGGEPLLHPDVGSFVHAVREAFPRARTCLMTNGILVPRMDDSVWSALEVTRTVLLCDDYPVNLSKELIESLGHEHHVAVEWMPPAIEFFKAPIDPSGSCDAEASFTACQALSNCAIIRDGRLYPCARVAYADAPAKAFGLPQIIPTAADSIDIFKARDGDEIIRALTRPAPWCRFCDYGHLETYAWGRTRRRAHEWVSEQWLAEHHHE